MIEKANNDLTDIDLLKKMGMLIILTAPFDIFTIKMPIINISIYRISAVILILFFLFRIFRRGEIKKSYIYLFLPMIVISSFIGLINSIDPVLNNDVFFSDVMGVLIIFIFINIYKYEDISFLLDSYLYSLIPVVFFNAYIYYVYFFQGKMLKGISVFNIYNFEISDSVLRRWTISGMPRASMPFSSPPLLGLAISIGIIIIFFKLNSKIKIKLYIWYYLFLILLVIVFFCTMSRSIIVALCITFLTMIFLERIKIKKIRTKNVYKVRWRYLFILFLLTLLIFYFLLPSNVGPKLLSRLIQSNFESLSKERHYLVLLDGTILWTENIKNFLIGIGTGSSIYYTGKHTFFGPNFFNSYFTILVERGILGFIGFYSIYFLIIKRLYRNYKTKGDFISKVMFFIMIDMFVSFVFYDMRAMIPAWIMIAIMCITIQPKNKIKSQRDF